MNPTEQEFHNPFRPGAGHMPPYLAGREPEREEFQRLLTQNVVLENMVLTGLRGSGKTVLLDTLKPAAIQAGWLWVGTDLSESTSVSEEKAAIRLLADLSVVTSSYTLESETRKQIGFGKAETVEKTLNYEALTRVYASTPGLASDKMKSVLETVWSFLQKDQRRGLIFAYDEAQNLSDHAEKEEFPLSLLLDVFQSIQKKGIPFMLALSGLPTLFPKLVETRTFSERMFRVLFLDRLSDSECREAIRIPTERKKSPLQFQPETIDLIASASGGYPYFIQFICREAYDFLLQEPGNLAIPLKEIVRKLDTDFFAGRWSRATDRQRELLQIIARLENCDSEFTVQEVVELSKQISEKPFGSSHVNQMLATLGEAGLIYKNRHGRYSFAVPLFGQFVRRQEGAN